MYNTGNSSKNVTTTSIVDGTISNADVDASAAIAQSKLATLVITDSEVANDALSGNKIDGGTISGSVTLVTPDIGTPSAGVLTNCSGTASSLTAGNVTNNANLTGVVTSTGNATAIAADAISGDKIDGGTISDFASTGIDDNATGTVLELTSTGRGISQFTLHSWLNFDGTGTVAIRDSHNVSSITDSATGDYIVYFDTNQTSTGYTSMLSCGGAALNTIGGRGTFSAYNTVSSYRIGVRSSTNQAWVDEDLVTGAWTHT